jgi:hypothetical protein
VKTRLFYFALFDFDGTAGETFKPAGKNGIGVNEAYRMACDEIFGHPTGSNLFGKVGGLQNRAPTEFMSAILEIGERDKLIAKARGYHRRHGAKLAGYVPSGKGGGLAWDEGNSLSVITELFVRVKLKLLTAQIGMSCEDGSLWPSSCPGFIDLWRGMLAFNETSSDVKFVPGIISSGHDIFIQRCFRMWGLPEPGLMVTDDTMRSPAYAHLSVAERTKPQVGPVRVLCEQWLKKQGRIVDGDPLSCIEGRGFYGGDGLQADGKLAENLGLCFLWFNPEGKYRGSSRTHQVVNVRDWREIIGSLTSRKGVGMMRVGLPFAHIARTVFL